MGIPAWDDVAESKSLLRAEGMYFEGPNRYDFSPGIYIAVVLNYVTDHHNIKDMLRDALEVMHTRIRNRLFLNPQRPIPGRRALWFKLEPSDEDSPSDPLPSPEDAYRIVYGLVMRLKRGLSGYRALPLRWRHLKIFWRSIRLEDILPSVPSVIVHDPALLERSASALEEETGEGEEHVLTEVEDEWLDSDKENQDHDGSVART